MVKLSDLVNVNINQDEIEIQGEKIPIMFSMESMEFVHEIYGASYVQFEKAMRKMLKREDVVLGVEELKIMRALIYAMVRAGGTECTPRELEGAILIDELPNIYTKALDVWGRQYFSSDDKAKIKNEEKK
ncbi:hypothetical protein [Listeria monocytogenes]|uniref:hypothetical protein n=1 Tax=Listeria monocytogenes TaxID=1639 RepID=UPI0008759C62|nr:hypothetical protein [Listeria monocytogenes]EAC7998114.1 hypothetical protein [Listeria monocytogenes]EAC8350559.1 hypothetical protein [Listeria monocytogenes]EAD0739949.1 hypothetical protein [Listeria monocytogenes]EAD9140310.1 hypothetical protein [Listeria monocytogenes]EIL9239377.1 hypothetical protein [Listeria monocytogenes]